VAHFIGHKQAALVGFQPAGTFGDGGTGALTDGNDHAVCRVKHFGTRFFGQGTVLGFVQAAEHNALIGDLHRLFVEHKLHALQLAKPIVETFPRCMCGGRAVSCMQNVLTELDQPIHFVD